MPFVLVAAIAALSAIASAQVNPNDIPPCALPCLAEAIGNTTCGLTDYYCQCTTGNAKIQAVGTSCLCSSDCTTADLIAVLQNTNAVCSSVLSVSSQTYTPVSLALNACASATSSPASGVAGEITTTATEAATTAPESSSKMTTASGTSSESASATLATQTANAGIGQSKMLKYEDVVLGFAGLALLAV